MILTGATLKASGSVVGLVDGTAQATRNVIDGFSGPISDALRKRRVIAISGYVMSANTGLAKILNVPESELFRLPRRSMKVLRETEVSLAFDGGNNVGMLALFHAAHATIKKTAGVV